MHWAHRAKTEFDRSATTWLGTVTLSPFNHALIDARVAAKAHETGASWQLDWTSKDYFRERCEVYGREIKKWLDRVRLAEARRRGSEGAERSEPEGRPKAVSELTRRHGRPRFSYLCVAEMHQSERTSTTMLGRPHWHLLIHEPVAGELVRPEEYYLTAKGKVRVADGAMLKKQWLLGFSQWELCTDSRAASYLCKYLSKDMQWRVRASEAYGEEDVDTDEVRRRSGVVAASVGLDILQSADVSASAELED